MSQYLDQRESEHFLQLREILDACTVSAPDVFDVGANVGKSVERFRHLWPKAPIHRFESNPSAFARLSEKCREDGNATPRPLGLADRGGKLPFHVTRISEMISLLEPKRWPALSRRESDRDYGDQTTLSGMLRFLEPLGYRILNILPFVYTCANRAWTANVIFVAANLIRHVESAAKARIA